MTHFAWLTNDPVAAALLKKADARYRDNKRAAFYAPDFHEAMLAACAERKADYAAALAAVRAETPAQVQS